MVSLSSNFDFYHINRDIAKSVKNIQDKKSGTWTNVSNNTKNYTSDTNSWLINKKGSYLSGDSSFSVQQNTSDKPLNISAVTVTDLYEQIADIHQTKEPLLDFMHKYNRNFDYKI